MGTKNIKIQIGLDEGEEWGKEKTAGIKEFIKKQSAHRSPEQVRRNELKAIQYKMEVYVDSRVSTKTCTIDSFVKSYLSVLDVSFRQFAVFIGTTDGNLKKYVSGERKFNPDLAMKFGHVFDTPPDIWLKVQIKNELSELQRGKQQSHQYKKYNMERLLEFAGR